MSGEDRELSQAIVAYVGKGRSPFPRTDADAAAEAAAGADPAALVARVRAILDEMMSIKVDGETKTLSEGGREAQRVIAAHHPELDAGALEALYWTLTYNWR